jgi:hypothetical protein
MKRLLMYAAVLCLVLSAVSVAFSGEPVAFSEEKATVTKNGADTYGQVFTMVDSPAQILLLAGDRAFMLDTAASRVYDAAINSVNDKAVPVMIDYGVLSEVPGAGLTRIDGGGLAFVAKGDRYEIRPHGRLFLMPE